jgi:amino acid adenylation domain-containing protein/non-ribosomal peptide synthase protein (TIGR01720 family)
MEQFEPDSPTYHIYPAYRVRGKLNLAALEQSFNEIIRRHEALRTTFVAENGPARQIILPARTVKLPIVNLSEIDPSEQESHVQRLALNEALRPFDLESGPLLRASVLALNPDEHLLLFTFHHIVSDGWSMGIFFRELAALYQAYSIQVSSPLPELAIQYADFAVWQRSWLTGERLQKQLAYWRQQLAGSPPTLDLTTDRPRPALQNYQGATQRLMLSRALTESLKQLSQREGATIFMLLLAAFNTLLYRYTQQEDILVGTPIAGRSRSEVEGLIGLFLNTLVLRTNLSDNPTFQELLKRVRDVTLDAYAHQDLPFEKLVNELQPGRNLSSAPIFQVMFDYQSTPSMALDLPELTLEYMAIERETAVFDLAVAIVDTPGGLRVSITYRTDLFESTSISRMLHHFDVLLASIVLNPQQSIASLNLLDEDEEQRLTVDWNKKPTGDWQAQCIHRLFEFQVAQTPLNIAVICDEQQLSYGDLNRHANQLACYLQSQGVKPGVCVGLFVERSLDIIIGLLAILKTGGVYVPLDPSYPEERLAFMLQDTQMPVLLTQKCLVARLPASAKTINVVSLDSSREIIAQQHDKNIISGPSAESLAYVIYTSGSTGQPKGVLISHEMCLNHCRDIQDHFAIEATDRVLQFASINFDVSLEQILPTLIAGATIVLRGEEFWSAADFYRELTAKEITIANLPTAYWQQVVHEGIRQNGLLGPSVLKLMIPGGESVQPEVACLWQQTPLMLARLLNAYGPTETTMTATTFDIPRSIQREGPLKSIPIGRPLANRTFFVLDQRGEIVPIGVPGELHIGGPLLAWGYLNQPELTADYFIPDGFSDLPGSRLYTTGDLVRYLPDGNLEFLGRADRQVKIRGFRIEPGEIEVALNQHSSVQASAVIVREDVPGEKRLVAYIVSQLESPVSIVELRTFLGEKIPSYMIPAIFVMLDKLPLTPNGKVDYRTLPVPEHDRPEVGETYVGPSTVVEETLVKLWSTVLGVESIGVHDNFFKLGGDSILGIQIIARANQSGVRLTPKQLFQFQTIAELAAVAGTAPAVHAEQGLVTGPVPLTAIQHWFFERDIIEPHHYNQSFLFDVSRNLKTQLMAAAVRELFLHHDALRLRFVRLASGWEQFNAESETAIAFEEVDLSNLLPEDQRLAIQARAQELQASLNLAAGPVARCVLFERGGPEVKNQFLLVIHHLVVDGVSWRIIMEDLQTCYEQLERGEQIKLPAKTSSMKQWAERLVTYARSNENLKRELQYWCDEQDRSGRSLPIDHQNGSNRASSARVVKVSLTEEETTQLIHEAPSAYNTQINDILLAALALAYRAWTGETSLLIDLEGHGREALFDDADLTRTVGWFTSIFPVRLEITETDAEPEALKRVKEHLRAIPNRGIGYGLAKYLSGNDEAGTKLRAGKQAEVSFNYLGQLDQGMNETSLFTLARETSGEVCNPQAQRSHLVDVNALIVRGQLQINWIYSDTIHHRATIDQWARTYITSLKELIQHCMSPDAGGFTPSDFPESDLSAPELEVLLLELKESQ